MPEAGAFGTALNWRSARGCGLEPTESYHVVLTDGTIVAAVIRNYIPEELAVGWVELEEHHKEHADMWGLGCEAEPDTNIERTAAALKHAKGAAGYRIQKGMTVHSFGPRGGDVSNKLTITYTNCQGRTVCNFGIGGCPIERHQHSRRSLDYLYNPPSRASRLLECLEHGYAEHVKLFMKQKGFPTQVIDNMDTHAHLAVTTLRVNEGSSRCGIHHDPPAPLPALVAGPTGYRLSGKPLTDHGCSTNFGSEVCVSPPSSPSKHHVHASPSADHLVWEQKHRGGKLFLFDGLWDLSYGPRDLVLLDGRFSHGVSVLRDMHGHNQTGSRAELSRMSLILFSTWQREKMKGEKALREGTLAVWRDEWLASVPWRGYSKPTPDIFTPMMLSQLRKPKPVHRYE
uniref:Uncharacterized protein n=1 Tax=Haptolina brevifila TaxID=156173 RepID=A0A7S2DVR3_9EUKA